ncbi:MAG: Gfo/Idh/MocA family oxidoreductase [Propionibacteriaceae bacterium]
MKALVIGVGTVATQNYLPFLSAQPDLELGYVNRTPEKAVAAAEQFGGTAFPGLADADGWAADLAFVLTSERARYESAREAIELGVPRLFLEKPLVAERGQADVVERDFVRGRELVQLAEDAGCTTAMIFNYRFFEQVVFARETVRDRGFGALTSVTALSHYACWSHCIDLITLFSGPVVEIAGTTGPVSRSGAGITAPEVAATFTTETGATGTLLGTAAMAFQHPLFDLSLNFEGGRIHLRDLDGTVEVFAASSNRYESYDLGRNTSRWQQYAASFVASLTAYLGSVRAGEPPPIPGIDGLRELQFEAALKKSIAEGRRVTLADAYPLGGRLASPEQAR